MPGSHRLSPLARIVVTLVTLGLLVVAAVVTEPWGFMALGSAIGLLVVAQVPAAQAGLRPIAALGSAALPLLLPFFVFLAAGVVKSPAQLQFAVGLVTLLLAWALIRPDWDRVAQALKRQEKRRKGLAALAQVGIPLLIGTIALAFLAGPIVALIGNSDLMARNLFILAAGALAVAAVLRVIGYAHTIFRALVALALIALLVRLAGEIGLLSGRLAVAGTVSDFVLVATALLALTALVEVVTALLARDADEQHLVQVDQLPVGLHVAVVLERPPIARWITDRSSVIGAAFALFSAILLLCAVFAASRAGGANEDLDDAPRVAEGRSRLADLDDRSLAARFAPVLVFADDQRWTPTSVDAYVSGATVRDWEGRAEPVSDIADLATSCPGVVRSPCYFMRQQCPRGAAQASCADALADDKAVYVRVARKEHWADCKPSSPCADGSPDPFARARGTYADDTDILIQYWFFYPYNEWVAPVAVGALKEIHAADWEAVTIGLSDERPLWVALSAHCAGTYAGWSQMRAATRDPAHLRPLVAVAVGSQANYRVARQSRVPNFAECSGITGDRITLLSYAANIRDRTDDAKTWAPESSDLRIVDARTRPMSYPGTWAPFARMQLDNLRKSIRLGHDTAGPASPPLQSLWQRPMNVIFGGGAWVRG